MGLRSQQSSDAVFMRAVWPFPEQIPKIHSTNKLFVMILRRVEVNRRTHIISIVLSGYGDNKQATLSRLYQETTGTADDKI